MGNPIIVERGPGVRVVASPSTWIEGEALRQLDQTATLPGMRQTVGMPDLHPGKGNPVGAAFLSEGLFYPALVGSDIGCGMSLWQSDLPVKKARPDKLAARLEGLDTPWEGDIAAWLAERDLPSGEFDDSLGTPGFGNHFAEIQAVHSIEDAGRFAASGLDADSLCVLVHTGSRGLGEAILRRHLTAHGAGGVAEGSEAASAYLTAHDQAVRWAEANRDLVAHRVLTAIGAKGRRLLDVCHNGVTASCGCWLHRKGAAPSDKGLVVIPGSRGALSYLVDPVREREEALWSLAHGAGRKMARHEAKGKLRNLYRREDLDRNAYGGRIVCGSEQLLWEEAPEAYKDVDQVVGDLADAGLLTIVAAFRPLVTFKASSQQSSGREKAAEHRNRREHRKLKEQSR
ncbi:RNA ligase RtcB family protein [Lacibacterium aquatile]|uniref:3'-phosphate/5'-hydroxy nucleic acid ligase n=1 Tax=Lacibacterium aquatile TaxID=1168082 RepID=A0ABW5DJX2_9PROT